MAEQEFGIDGRAKIVVEPGQMPWRPPQGRRTGRRKVTVFTDHHPSDNTPPARKGTHRHRRPKCEGRRLVRR